MKRRRMLDLFCGFGGWSAAFLLRGWQAVGFDIEPQPYYTAEFIQADVLSLTPRDLAGFSFVCASSPCEQFSLHGMKHFHPDPPFPELGIRLFEHTREICEAAKVPYVMENVRAAQHFVGWAQARSAPFYLWGNAIPPLLPKKCAPKGIALSGGAYKRALQSGLVSHARAQIPRTRTGHRSEARRLLTARAAMIPIELSNAVADYADRLVSSTALRGLMIALLLAWPALQAQSLPDAPSRIDRALYAADFTVRALDFKTTRDFMHSPCRCFHELDPIAPHTAAIAPQAAFQFGLSAAVILGSRELAKRHHPRWARALLLADIVDESIAVENNMRLHLQPVRVAQPLHLKPVRR